MYTDLINYYTASRFLATKEGFTLSDIENNMYPYEKEIYILLATKEAEEKAKRLKEMEANGR